MVWGHEISDEHFLVVGNCVQCTDNDKITLLFAIIGRN
jgi:hypothetical protein